MRTPRLVFLVAVVSVAAVGALVLRSRGPSGAAVFAASCSGCHSLDGRTGGALAGGDLSGYRLTVDEIASFARVMPVHPRLSAAEIRAVSRYVAARERPR